MKSPHAFPLPFFSETGSGWPQTPRDPPASVLQVLGFRCTSPHLALTHKFLIFVHMCFSVCTHDICVIIHVKAGTHMLQHMWRSEDNFKCGPHPTLCLRQGLLLRTLYTRLTGLPNLACLPLPLTWVLRIRTQILRSGQQVLYPLSHPPPHTTYLMTE